jgi:hypothetical protein
LYELVWGHIVSVGNGGTIQIRFWVGQQKTQPKLGLFWVI